MDHTDIARRFIAAIDAADVDAIRALYAPDARIWHDFDRVEQTVDENVELLLKLRKAIPSAHWEPKRLESLADGFVVTYELEATAGGKQLALPACVLGTVVDGRITRIEEWINTAPLLGRLAPEELAALA